MERIDLIFKGRIKTFNIKSLGDIFGIRKIAVIECDRNGHFKAFHYQYFVETKKRSRIRVLRFFTIPGKDSNYNQLIRHLKTLGKVTHFQKTIERNKPKTKTKKATEHSWMLKA